MNIGNYTLVGGGISPEQYNVFLGGVEVGYLRLRHGCFKAEAPFGGDVVYEALPEGDGAFEDHEREVHLVAAVAAIDRHLKSKRPTHA